MFINIRKDVRANQLTEILGDQIKAMMNSQPSCKEVYCKEDHQLQYEESYNKDEEVEQHFHLP